MANVPVPRSRNQILGDMVEAFLSRYGVPNLKVGGPILSMLEASAQSDLRNSEDIFTLLSAQSLDTATKSALDRIGADENLPRILQTRAVGSVTITDTSITRKSSKIYSGLAAPIVGTTTLAVADASSFPASGTVYLGRGTNNYEGPLTYSSKANVGNYWTITLSSPTSRFHNINETVVVGQGGNRIISAGTVVQTPQGNTAEAVQFGTLYRATIPDGEVTVSGVQVVARKAGPVGNVVAHSVTSFQSPPFTGATVTNPTPFSNGLPTEDNETYRARIRTARQSRTKGTPLALKMAALGVVAPDENKTVISAAYSPQQGGRATLTIDDGTGYEEQAAGVASELLIDAAAGGESLFKTASWPLARAALTTSMTSPFSLVAGSSLSFSVGGVTTEHSFSAADFRNISAATAYEITASINGNPALLWTARTSGAGTKVVVSSRSDTADDIMLVASGANDANTYLGFPTNHAYTARLYKNDRLLTKDGRIATLSSNAVGTWGTISGSQTLAIAVDGTASVLYTFSDQDFIDAGTGYVAVVGASPEAWAAVFNAKVVGITATAANGVINLVSNLGANSRAKLVIGSCTLVTNLMFGASTAIGLSKDYLLDRNTGDLRLLQQLTVGDILTLGSESTRAFLQSLVLAPTVLSGSGSLWFSVDEGATVISTGLSTSSSISATVASVGYWGYRFRISGSGTPFINARSGDKLILWDSALINLQGTWTVADADPAGTWLEIDKRSGAMPRSKHQAVTLPAIKGVLACGGYTKGQSQATSSAELYDYDTTSPAYGSWIPQPPMIQARAEHQAVKLPDGRVFVWGGCTELTPALNTGEIYTYGVGWSAVSTVGAPPARVKHRMVLLNTGKVLVTGGRDSVSGTDLADCYLYDPTLDTWAATGSLGTARSNHALVLMASGNVLAAGGESFFSGLNSGELYTTGAGTWAGVAGTLTAAVQNPRALLLPDNLTVLVTGGDTNPDMVSPAPSTATRYYTEGGGFAAATCGVLGRACSSHVMALVNGNVVVAFGDRLTGSPYIQESAAGTGAWASKADPPASATGQEIARIHAQASVVNTGTNDFMLVSGGMDRYSANNEPSASALLFNEVGNTWLTPDIALTSPTTSFSLIQNGATIARTAGAIQQVNLSSGTYTASSFVSAINSSLTGALASVYRTNQIRVSTNSYNDTGDIALVSANVNGKLLNIATGSAVPNIEAHVASVESGHPETGTPDFQESVIRGLGNLNHELFIYRTNSIPGVDSQIVVLGNHPDSLSTANRGRSTNGAGFHAPLSVLTSDGIMGNAHTVQAPPDGLVPNDRVYFASPFSCGPQDDITVVVDGDTDTKRFGVNTFRKLKTVGSTYATTNTFQDADLSPVASLTAVFGSAFDFTDYTVYMRARVKTHDNGDTAHYQTAPVNTNQTALWRYSRLGPDGNAARLKYVLPAAANAAVGVATDCASGNTIDVKVSLAGGAAPTAPTLAGTSKIGVAVTAKPGMATAVYALGLPISSASRTTNVTTLTLTLPPGITDHGIAINDVIYVDISVIIPPTGLTSNTYIVTGRTSTTVSYSETGLDVAPIPNVGTVSVGTSKATMVGMSPAVAAGQFFRLGSAATTSSLANFRDQTLRITATGDQYLVGLLETYSPSPYTTLTWGTIVDAGAWQVFANPAQTVNTITTAVNALYNAADSKCPVSATVLGTGTGTVDRSSAEAAATAGGDFQTRTPWFQLVDGMNWVKSGVVNTGNYDLTFKVPITASLATGSDWVNEEVRIAPTTVSNLVGWFNTLGVTGLSSAATIQASNRALHLQLASRTIGSGGSIQVQGGSANAVTAALAGSATVAGSGILSTIKKADSLGLFRNAWVSVDNSVSLPRGSSVFTPVTANTSLASITTGGQFALKHWNDTTTYASYRIWDWAVAISPNVVLRVEKQGDFTAYVNTGFGAAETLSGVSEGDWAVISAPNLSTPTYSSPDMPGVNTGIFRVVRVVNYNTFWVENPNTSEVPAGRCDVRFIKSDSIMPGDTLSIGTTVWNGAGDNEGKWTVTSVGSPASTAAAGYITQPGSSSTVTVNTLSSHGLVTGNFFTLSPGETSFPAGKYAVTVASATQFTYTNTITPASLTISSIPQTITGAPFSNPFVFTVSTADRVPAAVSSASGLTLGSDYPLVQVIEGSPSRFIKQILGIAPNQVSSNLVDIKLTTSAGIATIGAAGGSVITALDKLGFSTVAALGIDGYSVNTGLIAAVNRVIYGDPGDPVANEGVAAANAQVDIRGPVVLRITVSLVIRVLGGTNRADIADQIRSSVAGTVNSLPVGQSVAFSAIIGAANQVGGVAAVLVSSQAPGADTIPVQPHEKPLVLDPDQDITITFAGQ